jgi:putative transcriptional regulator
LVRLIPWITNSIHGIRRTEIAVGTYLGTRIDMDEFPDTPSRRWTDLASARDTRTGTRTGAPRPIDVRAIRRRLHLTQRQFAGYFGFAVATLRHWERGNRRPTGPALVLLHVIAGNPHAVLVAVRKARTAFPEAFPRLEPRRSNRAPPGFASPP